MTTITSGTLMAYDTAETIREATSEETRASIEAAQRDGGAGVIEVDGRRCYVEGGETAVTYTVNMIDSDKPAAWMGLPSTVAVRPGAQDSGRVRYAVDTTDASALEAALDADDDVLEYDALDDA